MNLNNFNEKIKENKYYKKIKNDSFWNNLFKNSFWAFSGDAGAALLGLVITIVLIKLIGNNAYGILVLAQTYMGILDIILNVQSWKSVIQYGQRSLVEKQYNELNSYIKIGTILDVSTAILGGIIAILIAPTLGKIFNWSNELIICSQIFSITIFSHFSGTPTAILRILNKFNLVAIQKFITAAVKLIVLLIIYFVKNNVGLYEATIIYSVTDIVGNLILVIFAFIEYHRRFSDFKILKAKLPKNSKEFITFTLWGTVADIVDVPVNYFDVFIVSLLGNEKVSIFKVFKQCIAILQKVTSPIQQSILPQFSELSAKKEEIRGYEIVLKIRNVILKTIGPIAIVLGVSSPLWLKLLYGDEYANNWCILFIYLLVQTFALSYTTIHPYFLSLNKAKFSTIYVCIANVIYMVLAILLIKPFGLIGIVLAYFVQVLVVIYLKIINIKRENIEEKRKKLYE